MNKNRVFALAAAAILVLSATGCGGSSAKAVSDAPRVELTQLKGEAVPADFEGAPVEVLSLSSPIDFSYSSKDADMFLMLRDGVWYDGMDKTIPINQEMAAAMTDNFLNLHAVREAKDFGSMAEYGFNDPSYTLYITDSEKGEASITIGGQDAQGNYYLTLDDGKVYAVKASTVESMVFDYDSLVVRDSLDLNVTAADIKNAAVTKGGETTAYKTSDTEVMTRIAEGISALKPNEFSIYHATASDLESAEITPEMRTVFSAELNVDGGTKSLVVYVGGYANADETLCYVQFDGSQMISMVDSVVVDNLLNRTPGEDEEEAEE